jgi:enoyl-CoA hydratase/carnithine racemase
MGLVDRVTPQDKVLPEAIERARMLGTLSQQAYRIMKQNRVESTAQRILDQWEDQQRKFVDRWYSDEARLRLNAAMEKFQPR